MELTHARLECYLTACARNKPAIYRRLRGLTDAEGFLLRSAGELYKEAVCITIDDAGTPRLLLAVDGADRALEALSPCLHSCTSQRYVSDVRAELRRKRGSRLSNT
jgi:hypothetical protein